jgi:predicted deacylase
MSLKVGNLEAKEGEKKQGYLKIVNTDIEVPCTIINGNEEGKTVSITGGTHGGEYPGIETAVRLAKELNPETVNGKLIILHPCNLPAFHAKLQYIGPYDGKNLNREYPGLATGTVSQKIAYTVTTELHDQSDFYIDLHGGDIHEALEPFVIYSEAGNDEVNKASKEAASIMGIKYVCGSDSTNGTFGSAAKRGVPGVLAEIGQCGLWSEEEVEKYIVGVKNILRYLGVIEEEVKDLGEVVHIHRMKGLNAGKTGLWYSKVVTNQEVKKNEKVGEIKDYFGNVLEEYFAPDDGVILYTVSSLAINEGDPIIALG